MGFMDAFNRKADDEITENMAVVDAKTSKSGKGNVETLGDISGVVYTMMDAKGAWKMQLKNNMKDVGIDVDLNKLCR